MWAVSFLCKILIMNRISAINIGFLYFLFLVSVLLIFQNSFPFNLHCEFIGIKSFTIVA